MQKIGLAKHDLNIKKVDKTKNLIFGLFWVRAYGLKREREKRRREEKEGRRKKRRREVQEKQRYENCMESTYVWIMYGLLV